DQADIEIALDTDTAVAGAASAADERAEIDANINEVLAELDMAITSGEQSAEPGKTTEPGTAAPATASSAQQDASKPGATAGARESAEDSVHLELDDEFDLSSDISEELPKRTDAG
ncbi:MAG: hypothetical protein KJO24_05870, partial [Gammaproteobacteria bacterium]|nr:hypothetical protein [Gammaproteobacteria bacterium]